MEKLTALPEKPEPNQFYLIETVGQRAKFYLSDTSSDIHLLNEGYGLGTVTTAEDITLTYGSAGHMINTSNATTPITITLPPVEDDLIFSFFVGHPDGLYITTLAETWMGDVLVPATHSLFSDKVGAYIELRGVGGRWVTTSMTSEWFYYDVTPPIVPPNLRVDNVTNISITWTWDESPGAAGYQISLNGGPWLNTYISRSHTSFGYNPGDVVVARVRSYDALYNYSAASEPESAMIGIYLNLPASTTACWVAHDLELWVGGGDPVEMWTDRVSSKLLESTGSSRPILDYAALGNGLASITFDGVDDIMATGASEFAPGVGSIRIFVIANSFEAARMLVERETSAMPGYYRLTTNEANTMEPPINFINLPYTMPTGWHVYEFGINRGDKAEVRIDNVVVNNAIYYDFETPLDAPARFAVGGSLDLPGYHFDGSIAAVIVCQPTSNITPAERDHLYESIYNAFGV